MNNRIKPKAAQTNETDFIDPDQLKDVLFIYLLTNIRSIFLTICLGIAKQYLMNILENKKIGKRKPNDISVICSALREF